MAKSYTYEEVKLAFTKRNCTLLENNYKNNKTPMKYICECGKEGAITLKNLLKGCKCKFCGIKKRAKSRTKLNIEDVQKIFKERGYTLLETEYANCLEPLKCICPNGHISTPSLSNFKRRKQCKACAFSGSNNPRWNSDREQVKYNQLFRKKCYGILYRCLYATNQKKNNKTRDLLGYSTNELKEHIEKQSNWGNIKNKKWHLDHIFPIKAFVDCGINDLSIINSLENLRACTAKDNLSKNSKYDENKFKRWLRNHAY